MYILGIQYKDDIMCHDTGASLIFNNKLIGQFEEERFSRNKHEHNFPVNSIKNLLALASIQFSDINVVVISSDFSISKCKQILQQHNFDIRNCIFQQCDHHFAHIYSSYYSSNYLNCLALVVDGEGDNTDSLTLALIDNFQHINIIKKQNILTSLGYFYEHASILCGFGLFGCGKLMGLASYGQNTNNIKPLFYVDDLDIKLQPTYKALYNVFLNNLKKIPTIYDKKLNNYAINYSYYRIEEKALIITLLKYFEHIYPYKKLDYTNELIHYINFAAIIQHQFSSVLLQFIRNVKKQFNLKNLVLVGGCMQNCSFNEQLIKAKLFDNVYCTYAPHDGGVSLGLALYGAMMQGYKVEYNKKQQYSNILYDIKDIDKKYLDKIIISEITISDIANDISKNKIIAWFDAGSEIGPRALCHRSIIANPTFRKNLSIINNEIKHRENFRPIAPVISDKMFFKVFDTDTNQLSQYMLRNISLKKEYRQKLPAICHIDNTSRPQYLTKDENTSMYSLLEIMNDKYDIPCLINTSFNDKHEPIVETINEAIAMLLKCNSIDYIVFNATYCIKRKYHV